MTSWVELAADRRDRPLADLVDEREPPPLRALDRRRVDVDATRLELLSRALPVSSAQAR